MADRRESAGSSPSSEQKRRTREESDRPGPSTITEVRTDVPKVPRELKDAVEHAPASEFAVGNKTAEFIYTTEGSLGYKVFVKDIYTKPTFIELNVKNISEAVKSVLNEEIRDRLIKKRDVATSDIELWSDEWSNCLTNSFLMVMYQKVRHINCLVCINSGRFAAKVNVTGDIELPLPFAYCLSELGHVRIADLTKEMLVVPTYPTGIQNFGLLEDTTWSHAKHNRAVRSMKEIDIAFSAVDVKKARGSTWWLYRQVQTGSSVRLTCPLPEVNFHKGGAVLHTLFLQGDGDVTANEIADIGPLGSDTYGMMLQNPPPGIQFCTFRALLSEDNMQWQP